MTATAVNSAVKAAIVEGHRIWTQAIMVPRVAPPDLIEWEMERAVQDLYRAVGSETLMTRAEIEARYRFAQVGPLSMQWEEDEDGEMVSVPVERADRVGYHLRLAPRRHPLAGAVYVARQPIAGEEFSVDGMGLAFDAIVAAHGDYPQELRLSHNSYIDYCNMLVGLRCYLAPDGDGACFNGIPVRPQPRAPLLTLLAVYPLPGAGE